MLFIIFIILLSLNIYFNRDAYCDKDSWQLSLTGQRDLLEYQYRLGKQLMGWNLHCSFKEELKINNRILVIANHMNYLDGFLISKYLSEQFPAHYIHPVTRGDITCIPYFGNVIKNNCICLDRDFQKDQTTIRDRVNSIKKYEENSIILIFPEGTNRCPETEASSRSWCYSNSIKEFDNLLSPRRKGIQLLNEVYQPQLILDLTIFYPDDYLNYKAQYITDLLFNIIPKEAVILTSTLNLSDPDDPDSNPKTIEYLMKRWYQKDAFFNKLKDLSN